MTYTNTRNIIGKNTTEIANLKARYLGGGEAFLDWGGGGRAGDRPRLAGSVELQIKKEKILPYQSGLQVSHIIKHKLKGIRKMEITPTNYLTR